MGLDISAYEHVIYENDGRAVEDPSEGFVRLSHGTAFEERGNGLAAGLYRHEGETIGFPCGPYSSYGEWRARLCRAILSVEPQAVWQNEEQFAAEPFYELINFSDCEGVIGPLSSGRLAAAFKENREKFALIADGYDLKLYDNFASAFALAAHDGAVDFH